MRPTPEPVSIAAALRSHALETPAAVALCADGETVTYAQLWQRADAACQVLRAKGVQPGDRVAWLGLNDPAMLVLLLALARLGGILLPLNYRLARAEHLAILQDAQPRLLLSDDVHLAHARDLCQTCECALVLAGELLSANRAPATPAEPGNPDAALLLVYTSGTTGRPRGAVHTQSAVAWNCAIARRAQHLEPSDRVLTVLPLFHVGGLCIQTLPALVAGATVYLPHRFDAAAWLACVQAERVTLSVMVPATLRAVQEHEAFAATDLSSLRMVVAGSSIVPLALIERMHARQVPIGQVYGTTETGPVSIVLGSDEAMQHPGAAGRAAWQVEVRLQDTGGAEVAAGQVGEICLRAPNLMRGYWNAQDDPSFRDGWFHSGDLAHCDAQGLYRVVGRSRDMIISGGENIYPAEIENILAGHPDIADVAVLGAADARWGEIVVAAVVRRSGSTIDAAGVHAALDGQVARFKLPRRVVFVEELPKTALGKVQRTELAALVSGR